MTYIVDNLSLEQLNRVLLEIEADLAAAGSVTNGDAHDHSGGDGAQISHTGLSNLNSTTYTHLTSANHTDLTDGGATTLHKHDHGNMDGLSDDDHTQYIKHALSTAGNDFLVGSGSNAYTKKTLAETKTILGLGTMAAEAATDYPAKSLFDAHTILYATTDNTPAALSISEQTVVGRKTGGNIEALSASDARTVLGLGTMAVETATNYVAKSLYDAQTILQATSDNTPAALSVTEQTVVGRITSGNIAALSVAQLQTLLFSAAITENVDIIFATPSTDGKYSGIVMSGTAGATLAFGDVCYFAVADSRWELADADSEAKSFGLLGICVLAAANDGSATKMLMQGRVNAATAFPSFTIGAPVYLSTTDGDLTSTAPSGAGDCMRCVGHAITADEIWFEPSKDWYEHV